MTTNEFRALINKYAILIFVGYALSFLINRSIQYSSLTWIDDSLISILIYSLVFVIQLIINIIAAILISKDMKRFNINNNLIIVITVFFSLVGVVMFFITLNRELKEE